MPQVGSLVTSTGIAAVTVRNLNRRRDRSEDDGETEDEQARHRSPPGPQDARRLHLAEPEDLRPK